jgi:hypothetical protein
MEHSIYEKLRVTQLVKKFPTFYGKKGFITTFTTASQWIFCILSWMNSVKSLTPYFFKIHFNIISQATSLPCLP